MVGCGWDYWRVEIFGNLWVLDGGWGDGKCWGRIIFIICVD